MFEVRVQEVQPIGVTFERFEVRVQEVQPIGVTFEMFEGDIPEGPLRST